MEYRIEKDSMGEVQVPAEALYGASTQRAVDNFPISDLRFGRRFIWALGLIKGSAADVARSLEGDCTEHSVLLAALCRARKIPARVAIGLVYYQPRGEASPGYAYHMWTEVWVNQRWTPIDATLGRGGIGAAQ